ncbi:3'-5' exonuclease [Paeniroseomonas aquatica]|uniref:3'-5' exonuclease n=1 Tax=Paeniroseomonas aquatica TaxID=373043 RepID=UPI003623C796
MKREAEGAADAVRIMTVHGAKGLQAPVVIIPDVGGGQGRQEIRWGELDGVPMPLWAPRKEFHAAAFAEVLAADERRRQEEENRLLYVALTRAEDRLLVCGWGKEPKGWYALVRDGFMRLEDAVPADFAPEAFDAPAACDFEEAPAGGWRPGRRWRSRPPPR